MNPNVQAAEDSSRIAALTITGGIPRIIIGKGEPKTFPVSCLSAETLAEALDELPIDVAIIVGTRHDGTAGWNEADSDKLRQLCMHRVEFTTEAQALAATWTKPENGRTGYIILAEDKEFGGSARWYMQEGSEVMGVPVESFSSKKMVYNVAGPSIMETPSMLESMVDDFIRRWPQTKRLYVWSQSGIGDGFLKPGGLFGTSFTNAMQRRNLLRFITGANDPLVSAIEARRKMAVTPQ